MYTPQPKKLLIMNILDILRRYSDEDHRLSQQEIRDILKTEYGMAASRGAVKTNLMNLIDFGYELEYSESVRMVRNPKTGETEENTILSDFYLVRDFTDGELRLLIDSLLFSKHIPYSQCKELVTKLEGLSNQYFRARVRHILTMPENDPPNQELFLTIETLDEAITRGRQVSFTYNSYGTDKQLHPRRNDAGEVRTYIVNPYQMAAANGRYYLICNYDKYDDVANYRLDRISDIKLLDTPVKPVSKVKGLEHGFDLPRHMAEHIYMFTGPSAPVTFRAKKYLLNELFDYFTREMVFSNETEETMDVTVQVNQEAMFCWAMQYGPHVEVLSPEPLRNRVKEAFKDAAKRYGQEE